MSDDHGPAAGGLRERLASKARRRVVVTLAVSDPGDDLREVIALRQLDVLAKGETPLLVRTEAEQEVNAAALAAAEDRLTGHYADVALVAMDPATFEAIIAAYPGPQEGPEAGADAGMDWRAALPVMLAGCCVDDELRDETWWETILARPEWSQGELLGLWGAALSINVRPAVTRSPKG